jgi:hypothetical protein
VDVPGTDDVAGKPPLVDVFVTTAEPWPFTTELQPAIVNVATSPAKAARRFTTWMFPGSAERSEG